MFLVVSVVAIGGAMLADRWVAQTATDAGLPQILRYGHKIAGSRYSIAEILKLPGQYEVALVIAVGAMLACRRTPRWHAGLFIVLCMLLSGLNGLVKWFAGRARPFREVGSLKPIHELRPFHFEPFPYGFRGMVNTNNLCFPSGHAALVFASAAGLAILFPRKRWVFYTIAAITSVERFLETAHWFSDCVAAAALGIGGAYLIHWLLEDRLFAVQPARELTAEQLTS